MSFAGGTPVPPQPQPQPRPRPTRAQLLAAAARAQAETAAYREAARAASLTGPAGAAAARDLLILHSTALEIAEDRWQRVAAL
ncbi:hypothetical protein ACIQI7_38575 [Kitasatospora sp. NPDC092039]|uniref:hypothetical protein n=1 Tax=Kitasatospora sp. NPDC092039 TaxID=3364086 RepID=UPI003824BDE3